MEKIRLYEVIRKHNGLQILISFHSNLVLFFGGMTGNLDFSADDSINAASILLAIAVQASH